MGAQECAKSLRKQGVAAIGGKTSTSTQSVGIPASVLAQYQSVNNLANATAATPFSTYGSAGATNTDGSAQQFVAGINGTQQSGIDATNAAAGEADPYYQAATSTLGGTQANTTGINNAATGLAAGSAQAVNASPLTGNDINQYISPYLGDVLSSTDALANQNNSIAQSGALGSAISSGAFGGDRAGIAAANLNQQNQLAENSTNANILNTGYNNALSTAQQQQGVNLSAGQANRAALGSAATTLAGVGQTAYGEGANTASELGALGTGQQNADLTGAQAQIAAGTVQQQTSQAQDTAEYNQFLQQQSYPFQVDQFLANIAEGTGALSGSTTTTTQPGGFFSDARLKHDIKKIGKTYDGQAIYSYKMHGDARTHIGLIAQEVEKKHPNAVGLASGYRMVDYGKATEGAANRGHFNEGGVARFAKAGGGPSIVSPADYSAILAAQSQMYAPRSGGLGAYGGAEQGSVPRGGSSRVPGPTGATPHLVTAEGGLKQQPSGVQNLSATMNLARAGQEMYRDNEKHPVRHTDTTTPGGLSAGDTSMPAAASDDYFTPAVAADAAPDVPTQAEGGRVGLASGGHPFGARGKKVGFMKAAKVTKALKGFKPAAGVVPIAALDGSARIGKDGGGSLGDALEAQQEMYSPQSKPGRDIPGGVSGGGGSHTLAVANGTPAPAPSGSSNLQTGLGLVNDGQKVYKMANKSSGSKSTSNSGNQVASQADEGPSNDMAVSSADEGPSSDLATGAAAPDAAPAADGAATGAAADTAATDAAAGAAGDVAAGAATDAAAGAAGDAAAEAAAAIAAEYVAADAAVAVAAAKRGGKIVRKGYDTGGSPYGDTGGDLDIPDQQGADKLQTAGPLVKQPTGLQTLIKMGDPNGAGTMAGDMFSNESLARGGVARHGMADGGDPEVADPDMDDAPTAAPSSSGLGAGSSDKKSLWDKIKPYATTQNVVPLLQGIAAMGTAPTKHLGVALAAGLGAGASSYVPTQQGVANVAQTKTETQGMDIDNQIKKMKAQAAQDYLNPSPRLSPLNKPASSDAQDAAQSIDQKYRSKYFVHPGYLPDEQAEMQKAIRASMVLGDAPVKSAQQAHDNRVTTQTTDNQNSAQAEADQLYTTATTDPDPKKKAAALVQYNAVHQWTGDKYEDKAGSIRNTRTGQPPIGIAAQNLTPEQTANVQLHEAAPVDTGAPAKVPLSRFASQNGIPIPNISPSSVPATAAPPTRGVIANSSPKQPISPAAMTSSVKTAPKVDVSDAPNKPTWMTDPHHIPAGTDSEDVKKYSESQQSLIDDGNSLPNTQRELVKTQRILNLLPNAKTGPGTETMAAMQTALGNMTGSQFTSWINSNPSAYALLSKQLGQSALDDRLREMKGAGAQVRLGAQQDNLILNKLSASPEMPKDAIRSLMQQSMQDLNYQAKRQAVIPAYIAQGKDARSFDSYYASKNPLQNSLTTAAPAGTTIAQPMPSGAKLDAYAATHFGGDTGAAKRFLASHGYGK